MSHLAKKSGASRVREEISEMSRYCSCIGVLSFFLVFGITPTPRTGSNCGVVVQEQGNCGVVVQEQGNYVMSHPRR